MPIVPVASVTRTYRKTLGCGTGFLTASLSASGHNAQAADSSCVQCTSSSVCGAAMQAYRLDRRSCSIRRSRKEEVRCIRRSCKAQVRCIRRSRKAQVRCIRRSCKAQVKHMAQGASQGWQGSGSDMHTQAGVGVPEYFFDQALRSQGSFLIPRS